MFNIINDDAIYVKWHTIAIFSLVVAVLSIVSPQLQVLGHGLRTTLPALAMSWIAITMVAPQAFWRSLKRFQFVFILGTIFLLQATARFLFVDSNRDLFDRYVFGPLILLIFVLCIGALSELGLKTFFQFRVILLLGWCLSLAHGVPVLYQLPAVARLTMGNPLADQYSQMYAPLGVGNFTNYTFCAVCFLPMFFTSLKIRSNVLRWCAFVLLVLVCLAVMLSTFTMAFFLLAIGLFFSLLLWVFFARGFTRFAKIFIILLQILLFSSTLQFFMNYTQIDFVVSKIDRLNKGFMNYGLEKGDETNRGAWFIEEIENFIDEPFAGYIPGISGAIDNGHSSLSNSLVLFGFFGAMLWFFALWKIFMDSLRYSTQKFDKFFIIITWIIFVFSGIFNPTWHSSSISAFFAFTLPTRNVYNK